ncbi:MAG: YidC/Oxa1 family membrane protein insertase [Clostridia bacterium]|nr:YidC/Oxa1 family membrane protein insertase [Clostridia bacterium]
MKHIIPNFRNSRVSAIAMRLLMALLVLTVLGSVLTACGSKNTVAALKAQTITVVEGENALTSDQINTLATDIASNKNSHTIREYLVAASRGYDMTVEGFDDNNLPAANLQKVGEYGYNVIKYATFEVKDAWKYEKMNAYDVEDLVNCFKTSVTTDAKMDPLTTVQHWVALGFEWLINVPGFGSFMLGTVYFAIVVEILMLPLGIYQQKNSRKQALLRPKEMAIRKKYAGRNDQATQQKVSQEVAEMYQKEGFSPMAGCLPLLLTFPFIIALYNIVINPLKYMMGASDELISALISFSKASKAAGGLGLDLSTQSGTIEILSLIRDGGLEQTIIEGLPNFAYLANGQSCADALNPLLSRIPDFTLFGINFGLNPGWKNPWLLFIPVVTFALYYFSTKLNRKLTFQPTANDPQNGCSNTTMNIMMPAMSAIFTMAVPGAVGLYWGIKSVFGMVKQVIISKVMPLPQFTEADFKAAEKELAAKEKNRPVKKSGTKNPNIRSLHHIDDEDDLEPLPQVKKKGDYVEDDEPVKEEAQGAYLGEATLKDDQPARQPKEKKKKKKSAEDELVDAAEEYVANENDENHNG